MDTVLILFRRTKAPHANYGFLSPAESRMLPPKLIEDAKSEIRQIVRRRATLEIHDAIGSMMMSASNGYGVHRGLELVSLISSPDMIAVSRLKRLLSTHALRQVVGSRVLPESPFRDIVARAATSLVGAHLVAQMKEITNDRMERDDFRPVSDREFRYQGLPFPANTWKRFERHLKDRVSELVRETALVLGRPAVLLTSQKAIDILEEGGKLKPGLELYIRSDRFV